MQLTDKRVYPDVEGRFEDPVVWRDELQYHLIVNDWLGRIAFYQRSKDGVHWVTWDSRPACRRCPAWASCSPAERCCR